jgi:hypothetical protein
MVGVEKSVCEEVFPELRKSRKRTKGIVFMIPPHVVSSVSIQSQEHC